MDGCVRILHLAYDTIMYHINTVCAFFVQVLITPLYIFSVCSAWDASMMTALWSVVRSQVSSSMRDHGTKRERSVLLRLVCKIFSVRAGTSTLSYIIRASTTDRTSRKLGVGTQTSNTPCCTSVDSYHTSYQLYPYEQDTAVHDQYTLGITNDTISHGLS